MSSALIAIIGVVYLVISIDQFRKANPAMSIMFAGYAISNIGLWWSAK